MSEWIITTDGTKENTTLKVDGKDITKNNKIVSINFYAQSSWKGQVSGDVYKGGVGASYEEAIDEKGTLERKSIGTNDTNYIKGIGQKVKQTDQFLDFIGIPTPVEVITLVDKIIKHCEDNKLVCPTKEVLFTRTKESLMDKISDLGITLEG